ncbi:MAG: NACHT domain-containing NTPase [Brasilonema angustatum HA4187-MV1]|jgi:predicted NACHT family NTPase|nr:NACHT domain-containing NTPase [Brasilonema angustatum HA4187-MV1]
MPQNSLKACAEGIEKAKTSLTGKMLTNQKLAGELQVTRQPVDNFFNGKPVSHKIFIQICQKLELDWEEITGQKSTDSLDSPEQASVSTDIDALVQEVRKKVTPYIKQRCGTMQVLDMTQPIGLDNIYTDVNIFEKIIGRTRREIGELLQNCNLEDFDRFGLSKVTQERVPGLQAVKKHSKLMVFGKPGAGKTTFLKYLAMQCIEGQFQKERFPIFITLKDFAESLEQPNILEYIAQQLSKCKVTDANLKTEQLLEQGKALILLDGLDEVREEDTKKVLDQVQEFSYQFHNNQFIITCRIAAKEYTFQGFTEVEVADFDSEQIATFAQNWFQSKKDPVKGKRFIEKLKKNKPIEELATNPLLLTLLCLVFGEAGDFPANRSELYTEGVDVLLKKWDVGRNIERDKVYKDLSLQGKENLLSHIALTTFEQKNYFFKKKTVEDYIADFIRNLRNANTAPEALELDSEAILKSIEAQHGLLVARATGIYSFSHLTFHEYFTAREIKERSAWAKLAEHVAEKRWREVFLLTTGLMRSADDLLKLMKQQTDELLAKDEKLQKFLTWVKEKSDSVKVSYKLAAVRSFYSFFTQDKDLTFDLDLALTLGLDRDLKRVFDRVLNRDLDRDQALDRVRNLGLDFDLALDLALDRVRSLDRHFDQILALDLAQILDLALDLARDFDQTLNPELGRSLQQLKDQLPNPEDEEAYEQWWQENGSTWTEQLRAVMIEHRNIGHDWQFTDAQNELLEQYYDANKLLVDCLNSDCYVSREVRQEIEDTLLLPNAT